MADRLNRGEIWLLDLPRPDKKRPVLILSRPSLIRLLHTVTVAAVTSTLRGAPTEVELGVAEGLKGASCVNLSQAPYSTSCLSAATIRSAVLMASLASGSGTCRVSP